MWCIKGADPPTLHSLLQASHCTALKRASCDWAEDRDSERKQISLREMSLLHAERHLLYIKLLGRRAAGTP